ncbi:D-ribose pyranase [Tepidibacter hydrothermalis]|uniref:D-ribose pyranase n=1 Tax=Tepidibacter hydrothermalis TaxID=3036126 RepID=A0ABY8EEV2_9FIRM|nr:D-ribose pyranase [Tepidibacter hydrothermalis]WFD11483.1 D-ribose pyranase [Tepidibacter hydrothermalis]
MKKGKLINSEISYVISKMGHTDMLTICDSGLPIPQNTKRIDLALKKGIPSFLDTLDTVLEELQVEEIIIASQMEEVSPELYEEMLKRFNDIKIVKVEHEEFKNITKDSMAVVRTGEFTPYANVILKSGVVF